LPTLRRLLGAAALLAGAVVPMSLASPAHAAACSDGVTVIVDHGSLGGGVDETCVAGGGGEKAAQLFSASHSLTRVQRFPGAVCKVDGLPDDAGCVNMPPADAYWGLFWSDGSGGWTFSSTGVDALTIPNGGAVAFAWQDSTATTDPGVAAPVVPKASATPTRPTTKSSQKPTRKKHPHKTTTHPASLSVSPTPRVTASGSATASSSAGALPTTSASPTGAGPTPSASTEVASTTLPVAPSPTTSAAETDQPSSGGGLPGWVAPVVVVAVLAAGGGIAVARRRRA
jgi:hypothetical protein